MCMSACFVCMCVCVCVCACVYVHVCVFAIKYITYVTAIILFHLKFQTHMHNHCNLVIYTFLDDVHTQYNNAIVYTHSTK